MILESAVTSDRWWLDQTQTSEWQELHAMANDTSIKGGWVKPDGTFYRCVWQKHDDMLYDYLQIDSATTRREHWIHCHPAGENKPDRWTTNMIIAQFDEDWDRVPTPEQVRALLQAGCRVEAHHLCAVKGWSCKIPDHEVPESVLDDLAPGQDVPWHDHDNDHRGLYPDEEPEILYFYRMTQDGIYIIEPDRISEIGFVP